jgi:hypothetical protein
MFTDFGPNKRRMAMDANMIIQLVLKVVAMAMGIVSIVMGFFPKETTVKTHIRMLSIGLSALGFAAHM